MISILFKEQDSFKIDLGFKKELEAIKRLIEEIHVKESLEANMHYEVSFISDGVMTKITIKEFDITAKKKVITQKELLFANVIMNIDFNYRLEYLKDSTPKLPMSIKFYNKSKTKKATFKINGLGELEVIKKF